MFRIREDLFGLNPVQIAVLSLFCAISNSALLNSVLMLAGQSVEGSRQIMAVVIGDSFGTAIVLLLISVALSSTRVLTKTP